MKALVKRERGDRTLTVMDVPTPQLQADTDVIIHVTASGICGTDLHILHDEFPYWPPVTIGHEFVGVVDSVGSAVTSVQIGDRVVAEPHTLTCGTCEQCMNGQRHLCKNKRSPGWGIDGGDAPYVRFPEPALLHKVPTSVLDTVAVLAEPLAVCTYAVTERVYVEPMDVVAIVGVGPIGLLSAVAARASGASKIFFVGLDSDEAIRFPMALEFGADAVINASHTSPEDAIYDLTEGRGVDVVIEASGSTGGINTAIHIVKQTGKIGVIAIPSKETVSIEWSKLVYKVATVSFSFSSNYRSWERALRIMESSPYDLSKIVTHRGPIDNWKDLFHAIESGKCMKGVFLPND